MGKLEQTLADFVVGLKVESVPPETQRVLRRMVMAVVGTGFAGAAEDGVPALRELLCEAGGAAQATTVEAANLQAALAHAKGCPIRAMGGSIEVAEAMDM